MEKGEYNKIEKIIKKLKAGDELKLAEKMLLLDFHHNLRAEEYCEPLIEQTTEKIGSDLNELLSDGFGYRDLIESRINFLFKNCNKIITELSRKKIIENYLYEYDMKEKNQLLLESHFSKIEKYYNSLKDIVENFNDREDEYSEMYM